MAGEMHINRSVDCWVDPAKCPPATLPVRSRWSYDGGAVCPHLIDLEDAKRALDHDPACAGCARALRSRDLREGKYQPHPTVKTQDTWAWKVMAWWRRMNRRMA